MKLFSRNRRATQIAGPLNGRIKPGNVMSDGTYPHGTSTEDLGQWLLRPTGNLPVPAFGYHPCLMRRLMAVVATAPAGEEGRQQIRAFASDQFQSAWVELQHRFRGEIANCQRAISRDQTEREKIQREIETAPIPQWIPASAPRLKLAEGRLARAAFFFWAVLWIALSFFSAFNGHNLILATFQDDVRAWCFAVPLVLIPIGIKLALDKCERLSGFMRSPWLVLLVAAAGLFFAAALGQYGVSRSLEEIESSQRFGHDWRFLLWASFLLEILASTLIFRQICSYILREQPHCSNPDYELRVARQRELDVAIGSEITKQAQASGYLQSWEASLNAVIGVGLAYHRLREDRAKIAEEKAQTCERLERLWLPRDQCDRDDGHDHANGHVQLFND